MEPYRIKIIFRNYNMPYQNFNFIDTLLSSMGTVLDRPIKEFVKKSGITEDQLNKTGPLLISYCAKGILRNFIVGRSKHYYYDLYPNIIFSLKQFTLALNDEALKEKVSLFLANPTIETAQNAVQEFCEFDTKHFTQEQIDDFYDDKPKELK